MTKQFLALAKELEQQIKTAYEGSITIDEAEKLAAKFLHAQIQASEALKVVDLDARMKKTGVKAVKAAIYLDEATKGEKKPSDTFLQALVDSNELVRGEQNSYDEAEVNRDALQNYLSVFKEAHIYFRNIGRGRFE